MDYAFKMFWRERFRYLSAVLAVTFSAVLIAVQCGLLLGMLISSSAAIDHTTADIWISTRDAPAMSLGQPIPESWLRRLASQPEIEQAEILLEGGSEWHTPGKSSMEMCTILGFQLEANAIGKLRELPDSVVARLTEPGAIVVDSSELEKMGLSKEGGEIGEINETRVRVVGAVDGFQGITSPFVFCSLTTARMLLPQFEKRLDRTSYVLGKCRYSADAPLVVERLRERYPEMGVYTSAEFSQKTRTYWLLRSKVGTVMACAVVLALLVGLVVTSQTLYGATRASLREYAVLDALGAPRWRLRFLVLAMSFWIGAIGVGLALPIIFGFRYGAGLYNIVVLLPSWLMYAATGLTMGMVLLSGITSLRALRSIDPATLLR